MPAIPLPESDSEGDPDPFDDVFPVEQAEDLGQSNEGVEVVAYPQNGGENSPDRLAARDPIPASGWAACGNFDSRDKLVKSYYRGYWDMRMVGQSIALRCGQEEDGDGRTKYGYLHIKQRHGDFNGVDGSKFQSYANYIGRGWQDVAAWALQITARDPDHVVRASDDRFCIDRRFAFLKEGQAVKKFRAILWLGETGRRVMTFYPARASLTTDGGQHCATISNGPVIFSEPPKV